MKVILGAGLAVFLYFLFENRYHIRCDGTVNDPHCTNMISGALASFRGQ